MLLSNIYFDILVLRNINIEAKVRWIQYAKKKKKFPYFRRTLRMDAPLAFAYTAYAQGRACYCVIVCNSLKALRACIIHLHEFKYVNSHTARLDFCSFFVLGCITISINLTIFAPKYFLPRIHFIYGRP